jgi:hypothetical protein
METCVIKKNFWFLKDDAAVEEAKKWIGNEYLKKWAEHGI